MQRLIKYDQLLRGIPVQFDDSVPRICCDSVCNVIYWHYTTSHYSFNYKIMNVIKIQVSVKFCVTIETPDCVVFDESQLHM
jgi:hypothetical protein